MQIVTEIPRLSERAQDSHKGDFGKVLIIAGSLGMAGAASLAGQSALRCGAGLVRIATPQGSLATVAALHPCYTTLALPEDTEGRISMASLRILSHAIEEHDAVALGPGLGQSRDLCRLVEHLLSFENLPLLIDADGLNNLSKIKHWPRLCRAKVILTPHPGEMVRLWRSLNREAPPRDRQEWALHFSQQTSVTVILKGAGTVVTDGDQVYVNSTGNPGMATAGSGDVLTGVILALMGQNLGHMAAGCLGVYIHGLAGDLAAHTLGQISLTATDLLDFLPNAWKKHLTIT